MSLFTNVFKYAATFQNYQLHSIWKITLKNITIGLTFIYLLDRKPSQKQEMSKILFSTSFKCWSMPQSVWIALKKTGFELLGVWALVTWNFSFGIDILLLKICCHLTRGFFSRFIFLWSNLVTFYYNLINKSILI